MSKGTFELTQKQIQIGYDEKNEQIIEKETEFIFNKIITSIIFLFSDKVMGVKMDIQSISLSPSYLFSDKHKKNLFKWLERLINIDQPSTDMEFGKLKIDFENWYYQLGGETIEFLYYENYLITPQEAADALGVSKVTLNKYMKQGLESLDNGSHKKIPKYTVNLMKDPVYAIRMQMIAQEKKMRNRTPQERLQEINQEISEFQLKYGKPNFHEAFGEFTGDDMEDPTDYYRWKDLEDEMKGILQLRRGKDNR